MLRQKSSLLPAAFLGLIVASACSSIAQDAVATQKSDQPAVESMTWIHSELLQKATVTFQPASLEEIVTWLRGQLKLDVLVDEAALESEGISVDDDCFDGLTDEPIYLLLDRICAPMDLAWYVDEESLIVTTQIASEERWLTRTYPIRHLGEAGYTPRKILNTAVLMTTGPWMLIDHQGGQIGWSDNSLLVRADAQNHREVAALLVGLTRREREIWVNELPSHGHLCEALDRPIQLEAGDIPLDKFAEKVSAILSVPVVLREEALAVEGIHPSDFITIPSSKQRSSLRRRFEFMADKWYLTVTARHGRIEITSTSHADDNYETVIFDVADLCRDDEESISLTQTILKTTDATWSIGDNDLGYIYFPSPSTMVIRQHANVIHDIQTILKAYRADGTPEDLANKPKLGDGVITSYYKLNASLVDALVENLPKLVEGFRESEVAGTAEANIGRIITLPLDHEIDGSPAWKTLAITHRRRIHRQIESTIERIKNGDAEPFESVDWFWEQQTPKGPPPRAGGGFGGGGGFF